VHQAHQRVADLRGQRRRECVFEDIPYAAEGELITDIPQRIFRAELPTGTHSFRGRQIAKPERTRRSRSCMVGTLSSSPSLRGLPEDAPGDSRAALYAAKLRRSIRIDRREGKVKLSDHPTLRYLQQPLLDGIPTIHAQSCRLARLGSVPKGLHAVSPHGKSSVADIKEYTKTRDVVNHADDCNQIVRTVSEPSAGSAPTLRSSQKPAESRVPKWGSSSSLCRN
jgi:hypothetical protein